jgi:hypothetical protein
MIKKMEKEFTSIKMEESWKAIGKMINSLDKLTKKLILKYKTKFFKKVCFKISLLIILRMKEKLTI